ncbi:DUF928 domain-containing protein [Merismopedia glauca]|nr:DUF928 domain-containing protein [Merismopedia glauca]
MSLFLIFLNILPAMASPLPSDAPPPRTRIGRTKGVGTRGCETSPNFRIVAPDVLTTKVATNRPQFLIYAQGVKKYRVTVVQPKVAQPLYDQWFSPSNLYTLVKTDSPLQPNQIYRLTVVAPCSVDNSDIAYAFLLFQVEAPTFSLEQQLSNAQDVPSQAKIYADNGYFLEAISLIFTKNPEVTSIPLINTLIPDN